MKAQKKKSQNPLYVVKGNQVEAADGILDMLLKKFNLGPAMDVINALLKVVMDNVKTYAVFVAVMEFLDLFIERLKLFKQFAIV